MPVFWPNRWTKGAGMARKVRDKDLGDRASRAKLKPSGKPYWRILDQGLHLGYRKNKNSGKWVARLYQKGAKKPYVTDTLPGVADDKADPDNDAVLSFFQAQVKAREWFAEQQKKVVRPAARCTVGQALDHYEADARRRHQERCAGAPSSLRCALPEERRTDRGQRAPPLAR